MNKTIALWAFISFCIWFVWQISGILLPFVLAFILAYALNPVVSKMADKCPRGAVAGLCVGGLTILAILLILVLVPVLQTQVMDFIVKIPSMVTLIWDRIQRLLTYGGTHLSVQQLQQLSESVSETAFNVFQGVGGALRRIISVSVAFFSVISLLLITPVVLFYVLRDWPAIVSKTKEVVPMKKRSKVTEIMADINTALSGFIRGQASVCLILAIYYATALSVVGLNMGLLVGILTGVMIFIPYIGFGIGLLLSVLLGLLQGLTLGQWIGLGAVFLVGQIAESYFLTPYLVGKRVGLHPVWIIFVLLAGGMVAGWLGIILAVPVAAVLAVLIRHFWAWYKTTAFFKGTK